jgi:hypothetical protein
MTTFSMVSAKSSVDGPFKNTLLTFVQWECHVFSLTSDTRFLASAR